MTHIEQSRGIGRHFLSLFCDIIDPFIQVHLSLKVHRGQELLFLHEQLHLQRKCVKHCLDSVKNVFISGCIFKISEDDELHVRKITTQVKQITLLMKESTYGLSDSLTSSMCLLYNLMLSMNKVIYHDFSYLKQFRHKLHICKVCISHKRGIDVTPLP